MSLNNKIFTPRNMIEIEVLNRAYLSGVDIRTDNTKPHDEQFDCIKNRLYVLTEEKEEANHRENNED